MNIRIITDDFTSATDGAVAFAGLPGGARVILDAAPGRAAPGPGACSVDTDSRHCSPAQAAAAVARWASAWAGAGLLLKQFDSTLRGPIAAECEAAWAASGRARLLVVPAFPAAGRVTRGGRVFVHGEPLDRTAFARDPRNPVQESSLLNLFAAQGVALALAADAEAAAALFAQGHRAVLVDVADSAGLEAVAARFAADPGLLWAGSTGIARALAQHLLQAHGAAAALPAEFARARRPWVCVGSRHPASRAQLALLQHERPALTVRSTAQAFLGDADLLPALADEVASAVRSGACDGVVATGGDTAKALARALGVEAIRLLHEVEPGMPVALLQCGAAHLPVVTKAGGFGTVRSLLNAVDAIAGAQA